MRVERVLLDQLLEALSNLEVPDQLGEEQGKRQPQTSPLKPDMRDPAE